MRVIALAMLILVTSCGGSGDAESILDREEETVDSQPGSGGCGDACSLSAADVEQVVARAVAEADARDEPATIAVVDRVGNVLGVYAMNGADEFVTVSSTHRFGGTVVGSLEGLNFIPAPLAAIAKAITGAYLSTTENAFTTRTASQIVQENFNPGERDVPSGPLFGVQFSQLPCSDFSRRARMDGSVSVGPHRSPLGLAADPGGLPLYIDGRPVGGIGVISDGIYGLDKITTDFDNDPDELIALAGTAGFAAPIDIRANRITVLGKTLRYSDAVVADLATDPAAAPAAPPVNRGNFVTVPGYIDNAAARAGTAFGQPDSGIRPADPEVFADDSGESLDAFILVDGNDENRYPPRAGTDSPGGNTANRLTADEVQVLLNEAIAVANRTRAQIRVPPGVQARVTISVVDTNGAIVGVARTRDGPMFGADVSLQKARTAAFFSGTGTSEPAPADLLRQLPPPLYLEPLGRDFDLGSLTTLEVPAPTFPDYLEALQVFLGDAGALESVGTPVAFSDRAGGNLSRPKYPDGPDAGPPGPLSKPAGEWSIFSTGLQSDLVYNAVIQHVAFVLGVVPDVPQNCTGNRGLAATDPFGNAAAIGHLANGAQIFPGSVPIYRDGVLIGGIGVSGDGVDQDDLISFLAVHRAGERLDTGLGNAPREIRADKLDIPGQGSRLRYVNCPQLPFIDSNDTEVCDDL